jgi:hypothetical protein
MHIIVSGKMQRRSVDPLERFTQAKESMGNIYHDLSEFIGDLHGVYSNMENGNQLPKGQMSEVEGYRDSIAKIIEMFSRDKMKVVFFGRLA